MSRVERRGVSNTGSRTWGHGSRTPDLEQQRVSRTHGLEESRCLDVSRTPGLGHGDAGLERQVSNNEGCLERRGVSNKRSRTSGRGSRTPGLEQRRASRTSGWGSRTPGLEQRRVSRTRVCLEDKVSNMETRASNARSRTTKLSRTSGLEQRRLSRTRVRLEDKVLNMGTQVSNARSRTTKGASKDGVSRTPGLEHRDGGLEHRVSNKEGCLEQGRVSNTRS